MHQFKCKLHFASGCEYWHSWKMQEIMKCFTKNYRPQPLGRTSLLPLHCISLKISLSWNDLWHMYWWCKIDDRYVQRSLHQSVKKFPSMTTTHCFLHKEASVAKTCGKELTGVKLQLALFHTAVIMVNLFKSQPVKCRLFQMSQEMGAACISFVLHTNIRLLSWSNVLNNVLEFKEPEVFFGENKHYAFLRLL